jgi:cyclohexadienyl dehydratase
MAVRRSDSRHDSIGLMKQICLLLVLLACSASATPSPHRELFDLIDARLELMAEVAAFKWQNRLAIEDLDRETAVLDEAAEDALRVSIDPISSRAFFREQIEAAKDIQQFWFRRFETGESITSVRDLQREIRPELLHLGDAITRKMSESGAVTEVFEAIFNGSVQVEGLSATRRQALFTSLTGVQHFPDRFTQIRRTGRLRVGTTGDYAPFSARDDRGLTGIDITMAHDLAAALGVDLVLVDTSWPSLIADLDAGLWDIGMSGISKDIGRGLHGFFSRSYYSTGKTPIAKCSAAGRLASMAQIDLPGVRVVVNPGGTNHRFAIDNLTRATVVVHPDNNTIFDEIIDGRADVMITDAIEVALKVQQHPDLCPTMPGKYLTQLEKAYLMPADIRLKEFVNNWLSLRLLDGTYQRLFDEALNPGTIQ